MTRQPQVTIYIYENIDDETDRIKVKHIQPPPLQVHSLRETGEIPQLPSYQRTDNGLYMNPQVLPDGTKGLKDTVSDAFYRFIERLI